MPSICNIHHKFSEERQRRKDPTCHKICKKKCHSMKEYVGCEFARCLSQSLEFDAKTGRHKSNANGMRCPE